MPRKRDPQNAYRVRANIPTNSPDQLGTVILLIMKFSTPDFGPRVGIKHQQENKNWSRFLPLPLCGACPFVGTVVFVS